MTILIAYQIIGGQNSESFCKDIIWQFHRREFPCLAAYQRSVGIAPVVPVPLVLFPEFRMETGAHTGICVIGPTPPRVCPNLRIPDTNARRGKSPTGWFCGFRLHMVINHPGELMSVRISAGNPDDRKSVAVLFGNPAGKLLGDKGCIRKALTEELPEQGPD